jgi:hypothetical protein
MSDTDTILAGCAAAGIAFILLNICVHCLRTKNQKPTSQMKASPSMEHLNAQDDPVVV